MRTVLCATTLGLSLLACGGEGPPASGPPTEAPPAEAPPAEVPPPPAIEAPPEGEHHAAPTEPRSLGEPAVYAADVGGLVRHGDVLVRFGNGPTADGPAAPGPTAIFGFGDRARCTMTMEETVNTLPAGEWRSLTVTAAAVAPADADYCAGFAGTYSNGRPSDGAGGGAPPTPRFDGSECWLRPQITSDGDGMCASFAASPSSTFAVAIYQGTCCVGAPTATLTAPAGARGFLLTPDGTTLVAAVHDAMVNSAELAANPTLFQAIEAAATTELHVNALFAGDPVLAAGASFAVEVRLEGSELVVGTADGAEHRHAL